MRKSVIGAAAVACLVIPATGNAGYNSYHGTMCQPSSDGASVAYDQYGIRNTSTTSGVQVYCPIPVHTGTGSTFNASSVTVYQRNVNTPMTCGAYSVYYNGGIAGWITAGAAYGYNVGSTTLTSVGTQTTSGAYWYMTCTIPPVYNGEASYVTTYVMYTP